MEKTDKVRWHLYILLRPDTRTPFYIGLTTNPKRRLVLHLTESNGKRLQRMSPKERAIRGMLELGMEPEMLVLATSVDKEEMEALEKELTRLRPTYTNSVDGSIRPPAQHLRINFVTSTMEQGIKL